jgi:hypothetical protein
VVRTHYINSLTTRRQLLLIVTVIKTHGLLTQWQHASTVNSAVRVVPALLGRVTDIIIAVRAVVAVITLVLLVVMIDPPGAAAKLLRDDIVEVDSRRSTLGDRRDYDRVS